MTKIKTSLIALAAILVSSASASAADLYSPAPVSSWDGFYVGVHGGYAWGSTSSDAIGQIISGWINDPQIYDGTPGNASAFDTNPDGGFGGLQAGYNFEVGSGFLLGLEATVSYGDIADTIDDPIDGQLQDPTISVKMDWHGTVRGRAGAVMGSTLVYGTGGFAWGQASITQDAPVPDESATLTGWVAGAGIEHKFSDNLSVKVEYLYTDYGAHSWYSNFNGGALELESDLSVHSVSAGLNLHF